MAYVPAEDVQKTTILEKAIPVEAAYGESDGTYTAASWQPEYAEDTAADQGSGASAASGYTADSSAAGTSAADTYTDSSADNTYADTSSYDTTGTDTGASSGTDEPSEETVTTASTDDVSLLAALIYCEA